MIKQDLIYVLELESEKYYIGRTSNIIKRFRCHKIGEGSTWTKKYTNPKIIELEECTSDYDEDNKTIEYMIKFGIDNVRGGTFVALNLPQFQLQYLSSKIISVKNLCYKCGKEGHYANRCVSNIKIENPPAIDTEFF